jgi:uncharacterized protein (TIGR02118 family)
MVKLIALYSRPEDPAAFDRHYRDVHTPLAAKMPGLRKLELLPVTGSPMGEARYHLVAQMTFDSLEDARAALKSPEGMAAGKDLMGFAGKLVHLMFANVESGG